MYVIVARCNKMLKEVYNVPDMNEMDRRRYIGYDVQPGTGQSGKFHQNIQADKASLAGSL